MAGDEVGEALAALEAHKQSMAGQSIADFFRDDPNRFELFTSNSTVSCSISRSTA
jgi:hypothetical protein